MGFRIKPKNGTPLRKVVPSIKELEIGKIYKIKESATRKKNSWFRNSISGKLMPFKRSGTVNRTIPNLISTNKGFTFFDWTKSLKNNGKLTGSHSVGFTESFLKIKPGEPLIFIGRLPLNEHNYNVFLYDKILVFTIGLLNTFPAEHYELFFQESE